MTPRKPRQRQHNHQHSQSHLLNQVQASDYESEATYTLPVPTRTNTELNLSVLQRYNPRIFAILSIAASAQIYDFSPSTSTWEKSGIEGTLFVCQLSPSQRTGAEQYCIVLLNRRGLDNIILDAEDLQDVEIGGEFLILRFQEGGQEWGKEEKVMGVWMHADKDDTREVNSRLIKECWERSRTYRLEVAEQEETTENYGHGDAVAFSSADAPVLGRKLSLRDLFAQKAAR